MSSADPLLAEQLRSADPDRYLSTLYAPEEKRGALTALYAFNAEIAAIRDRIHEPLPGEVRLQWWRDMLDAGKPEAAGGHPLATALLGVIRQGNLPVAPFQAMLNAREFDLYDDPMPSRGDLEGYLGETASALIQLAAVILDRDAATSVANASGHAGCAQGIAGLLRLLPLHRARSQCFVPAEMLTAAGTTREELLAGGSGSSRAVEAMVALARHHWSAFLERAGAFSAAVRPAFLPALLTPAYLKAVERAGAQALQQPADIAAWRRQWTMFRAATKSTLT